MSTENNVRYHTWTKDEPLLADVFGTAILKDGGQVHGKIGQIEIIKGDAIHLNYGASRQVYTRSGKGYESEFLYGRATLHGCPVGVVLTQEQSSFAKITESSKEDFDNQVKKQSLRTEPLINKITEEYVNIESQRRKEKADFAKVAEEKRKSMILNALNQMEEAFKLREETPQPKRSSIRPK